MEEALCGRPVGHAVVGAYGFSDQTSSWVDNTSAYVTVDDNVGGAPWLGSPGSASADVGSADNDRADSFWIIC